jgi:hypothetical protein
MHISSYSAQVEIGAGESPLSTVSVSKRLGYEKYAQWEPARISFGSPGRISREAAADFSKALFVAGVAAGVLDQVLDGGSWNDRMGHFGPTLLQLLMYEEIEVGEDLLQRYGIAEGVTA